jgi:hypothetical protein
MIKAFVAIAWHCLSILQRFSDKLPTFQSYRPDASHDNGQWICVRFTVKSLTGLLFLMILQAVGTIQNGGYSGRE